MAFTTNIPHAMRSVLPIAFPTNTTRTVRLLVVGTAKTAVPTIRGNRSIPSLLEHLLLGGEE